MNKRIRQNSSTGRENRMEKASLRKSQPRKQAVGSEDLVHLVGSVELVHWHVDDKNSAELIVHLKEGPPVLVKGPDAWEIWNRRNMARSFLYVGRQTAREAGVNLDHVFIPFALDQVQAIASIVSKYHGKSL